MIEINKINMKKMAQELLIDADDDVIEALIAEWSQIKHHLDLIIQIDVEGIEPMAVVDESPTSFMREDIETTDYLNKKDLLDNAARKNEDYIIIKKVVK